MFGDIDFRNPSVPERGTMVDLFFALPFPSGLPRNAGHRATRTRRPGRNLFVGRTLFWTDRAGAAFPVNAAAGPENHATWG